MAYNKETGMYEGYIYEIFNNIDNSKYIGQTRRTIEERYYEHCYYAKHPKAHSSIHLYKAMNKYGIENFNIKIINKVSNNTLDELINVLNNEEIDFISKYKDKQFHLYNMTQGGDSSICASKPVIQYDLYGNFLHTYESISIASQITNSEHSSISSCCSRKRINTTNNFIWRFLDDPLTNDEILMYKNKYSNGVKNNGIKVDRYNSNKEYIDTFNTLTEASNKLGINLGSISSVCLNKNKTAGGYIWRFHYDSIDTYIYDNVFREYNPVKFKSRIEKRDRITGELLGVYTNAAEAGRSLCNYKPGMNTDISRCCRGEMFTAYGYHWCYEDNFDINQLIKIKSKRYDMYDMKGNYINTFESGIECINYLNIKNKGAISDIRRVCEGIRYNAYGYVWRYFGECFDKYPIKKSYKNTKKFNQYDLNDKFICTFNSIKEIREKLKIKDTSGIYNCCNNKANSSYGFKWKYA